MARCQIFFDGRSSGGIETALTLSNAICTGSAKGPSFAFSLQGRIQDLSEGGAPYEKWGGNSLQVRYTKSGGGGAVHFRSDIRKVGGGGGGGAIRFRYDTKSGGGGGGEFASGPIRKVERGRADTFVWHKENTLSLIINGYKEGAQALHTRARMNLNVVFNFIPAFFNCIHS